MPRCYECQKIFPRERLERARVRTGHSNHVGVYNIGSGKKRGPRGRVGRSVHYGERLVCDRCRGRQPPGARAPALAGKAKTELAWVEKSLTRLRKQIDADVPVVQTLSEKAGRLDPASRPREWRQLGNSCDSIQPTLARLWKLMRRHHKELMHAAMVMAQARDEHELCSGGGEDLDDVRREADSLLRDANNTHSALRDQLETCRSDLSRAAHEIARIRGRIQPGIESCRLERAVSRVVAGVTRCGRNTQSDTHSVGVGACPYPALVVWRLVYLASIVFVIGAMAWIALM